MSLQEVHLAVVGCPGHGKTTLINALRGRNWADEPIPNPDFDGYVSPKKRIYHFHEYNEPDLSKIETGLMVSFRYANPLDGLIRDCAWIDAAILVVAADEGILKDTRNLVRLLRYAEIECLQVYLSKVDRVNDPHLLELAEWELRTLLSRYEYRGDEMPLLHGSSPEVSDTRPQVEPGEALLSLVQLLDSASLPTRVPLADRPLVFPIEDVFSISGKGLVVSGRIEHGQLARGDSVEVIGLRENSRQGSVTYLEFFRQVLDQAQIGDNIGAMTQGFQRKDLERGRIMTTPGTLRICTRFNGVVYLLHTFFNGLDPHLEPNSEHRMECRVWTASVQGQCTFLSEESCVSESIHRVVVELDPETPLALAHGFPFQLFINGRIVGSGSIVGVG